MARWIQKLAMTCQRKQRFNSRAEAEAEIRRRVALGGVVSKEIRAYSW